MTPHLNCLIEMRGHNICFDAELTKIIPDYTPSYLELWIKWQLYVSQQVLHNLRNILGEFKWVWVPKFKFKSQDVHGYSKKF